MKETPTGIFRREALEHSARRLDGEVILAAPPGTRAISVVLIFAVAVIAAALCSIKYTRRETVSGVLVPSTGFIRVKAVAPGILETLNVQEGDLVTENYPIATTKNSDGGEPNTASIKPGVRDTVVRSTSVLIAPVQGKILSLPMNPGQSLDPGDVVAVMTLAESHLVADLYVPSRAAAFLREGENVYLMYDAFPFQTFGAGRGAISKISKTALAPTETATGTKLNEPAFLVRVDLAEATVSAYGRRVALQPGMSLRADVILDRRSLIQWIVDPIYAVAKRN